METALVDEGLLAKRFRDGHAGSATVDAFSGWQERLGYRGRLPGQPADGQPGMAGLKALGAKRGFGVVT